MTGDSVVFTGDGVEDLNRLIDRLVFNGTTNYDQSQRFQCDVGAQYSDWRPFDVTDVVAVRTQYIAYYGAVNKPDAYEPEVESSIPVASAREFRGSSPQEVV